MTVEAQAERALQAGKPQEAERLLRQALLMTPAEPSLFQLLARAALRLGRGMEAVELARHALALDPLSAMASFGLGVVLLARQQLDPAAAAFEAALLRDPGLVEAHVNLGNVRKLQGRIEQAVSHYRAAALLRPGMAEIFMNLGAALRDSRDFVGAETAARQALSLDPTLLGAILNLGNALAERGLFDPAIAEYHRYLEHCPENVECWLSLAASQLALGRRAEALAGYDRVVALEPEQGLHRFERALAHLTLGDLTKGWDEYDFRWCTPFLKDTRPALPGPEWQGGDPAGKTLFIHGEQGYGDIFQFVRYLPLLTALGAKVIFGTDPILAEVLAPLKRHVQWYASGDPMPAYDAHLPLLSLPRCFGTQLETIPAETPYLEVDPERRGRWRQRIASLAEERFKIGLVWSGRASHANDAKRSLTPEVLAPLWAVPGVALFSLQKDLRPGHLERLMALGPVHDLSPELTDFAETAAALEQMDLLISVDSAVAHLAGALGRPVWLLLARQADWRWLQGRDDSPWYPTLRLFRQEVPGEWSAVMERAVGALVERVKEKDCMKQSD